MKNTILIAALLAATATAAYFIMNPLRHAGNGIRDSASSPDEGEPLYWVAPMDPDYRRDEPGLSPMGMELVPVYEESTGDGAGIRVAPTIQHNLGLRTAPVTREDFARWISTVGYTRWDGSTIRMLHSRAEGWLEVFNLKSVGDRVEAGQAVYELFAPNLVSAQREYLNARQGSSPGVARASRDRLLALGFTREQVDALDRNGEISRRLVYRAKADGIVTAIGVREGSHVQPQNNIATLASLDTIWIDTEVFESDAGAVAEGQKATVRFPAFPGETWEGEVAYVYPELDATTRSLRVRLVIDNSGYRLKPNMFANVRIQGTPRESVLTVPREAVIRSGGGGRVVLAGPENRFRVQAVVTGVSSGGRTEIREGLEEGDVVVTSAQFLLDSEANGEQALARLQDSGEDAGGSAMEAMNNQAGGMAPASEEGPFTTTGTITRMNEGTVTISHAPVEALAWPSMEMAFEIAPAVRFEELGIDDDVRFEFERAENGGYRIIAIEETGGVQQ